MKEDSSTIVLTSSFNKHHKNSKMLRIINSIINKKFKDKENINITLIITAKIGVINKERNVVIKNMKRVYNSCIKRKISNANINYIDCSDKSKFKKNKNIMNNTDVLWFVGGDTMFLWYHLKRSGFDKIIKRKIYNDSIVCIGCCAGAIICGKTLFPVHVSRFNKKSKKRYINVMYKKKYWNKRTEKTFNFIDSDILPHCKNNSHNKDFYLKTRKVKCLSEDNPLIFNINDNMKTKNKKQKTKKLKTKKVKK